VNVAEYRTVEDCLAAIGRIRDSTEQPLQVERLALPIDSVVKIPLPAGAVDAARRCSVRWPAASAPLADFQPTFALYLHAGREADARALAARRLAEIPAAREREREAVLDTIVRGYLAARPARLADAEAMFGELSRMKETLALKLRRMALADRLIEAADNAGDTARARRIAEQAVAINESVTDAERRTKEWTDGDGRLRTFRALTYLSRAESLDSLRRSTAGYLALTRANWAKARGRRDTTSMPDASSRQAPGVEGEYWFAPSDPASGTPSRRVSAPEPARPTKGKVSLVVFLNGPACGRSGEGCLVTFNALKRIQRQLPGLEITLVTQTAGFFDDQEPPPPEQEAELYRKSWLEFNGVPAMLAVTRTEFWRLPEPDRRRIDVETNNIRSFSFGGTYRLNRSEAFLIDRDGTIVKSAPLAYNSERDFGRLAAAMLQRDNPES
jgi:hypothetical protein